MSNTPITNKVQAIKALRALLPEDNREGRLHELKQLVDAIMVFGACEFVTDPQGFITYTGPVAPRRR